MVQSLDQIMPEHLAAINSYLDHVKSELSHRLEPRQIESISQSIREQLFQQIEQEVASHGSFNLEHIIAFNKKRNQALLSGDDKEEVIFTIPFSTRFWKSPRGGKSMEIDFSRNKVQEDPGARLAQDPERAAEMSSQEQDINQSNNIVRKMLLPMAVVYLLLTLTTDYFLQLLSIGFLFAYLVISLSIISVPTRSWIQVSLLMHLGIFFAFTYIMASGEDLGITYVFIVVPIFSLIFSAKFLTSERIFSNFNNSSIIEQIIVLATISTVHFLLMFSSGFFLSFLYDNGGLMFARLSIVAVTGFLYSVVFLYLLRDWNKKLPIKSDRKAIRNGSQGSIDTSFIVKQRSSAFPDSSSDPIPNIQSSLSRTPESSTPLFTVNGSFQDSILDYFGRNSANDRVRLTINHDKAKSLGTIRLLSPMKIFLMIMSIVSIMFFLSIQNTYDEYRLQYYIDFLNVNSIYQNDVYSFRNDLEAISVFVFSVFILLLSIRVVIEHYHWFRERNMKASIKHLILREGDITIYTLSIVPPRMSPQKYYEVLGELTLRNVIAIRHLEEIA